MLAVLLDAAAPGQEAASRDERRDLTRAAAGAWGRTGLRAAVESPGRTVGAAVLVVGVVSTLWPLLPVRAAEASALPASLPGYSHLTQDASSSPPGPAVALYQQGYGVELFDTPQAVVVGAGGAVRRLDLAEGRGEGAQGDPGAMLLSPGGARVAVGRYDTADPDLAVQDLRTGDVVTSTPLDGRAVLPLAWSPDGARVLAVVRPVAWSPYAGLVPSPPAGTPVLVGADGRTEPLAASAPGAPTSVVAASWSPDGGRLALQDPDGQVDLLDTATGALTHLGGTGALARWGAWSPDGELLATSGHCASPVARGQGSGASPARGTVFVPTGSAPAPACVSDGDGYSSVVGWAGPRTLVLAVSQPPDGREASTQPLVAVDLGTGAREQLSEVPDASSDVAVSRLQVPAAALGASAERVPVSSPAWDHGRGALGLRLLGTLFAAGCAGLLVAAAAAVGRAAGARLRDRGRAPSDPGLS